MSPDPSPLLDEIQARADAATEGPWTWAAHTTADGDEWAVFDGGDSAIAANRDGWAPDAAFIAAARTDLPRLVAALRAVLEVHRGDPYLGEPGDATCPHDDDYDGDRHFESADGYWLCEDTAAGDFYCVGCRDEEGYLSPHPCATWQAVAKALEER